MKLTIYQGLKRVDLNLLSPIRLHGVMFNWPQGQLYINQYIRKYLVNEYHVWYECVPKKEHFYKHSSNAEAMQWKNYA
jgi:hypothetical protein